MAITLNVLNLFEASNSAKIFNLVVVFHQVQMVKRGPKCIMKINTMPLHHQQQPELLLFPNLDATIQIFAVVIKTPGNVFSNPPL